MLMCKQSHTAQKDLDTNSTISLTSLNFSTTSSGNSILNSSSTNTVNSTQSSSLRPKLSSTYRVPTTACLNSCFRRFQRLRKRQLFLISFWQPHWGSYNILRHSKVTRFRVFSHNCLVVDFVMMPPTEFESNRCCYFARYESFCNVRQHCILYVVNINI